MRQGFIHVLDEMVGTLLRGVVSLITTVIGGIISVLVGVVFYYTGWILIKILTLGNYPRDQDPEIWYPVGGHSEDFVLSVGGMIWYWVNV